VSLAHRLIKLKSMSTGEVWHRVSEKLLLRRERRQFAQRRCRTMAEIWTPSTNCRAAKMFPGCSREEIDRLKATRPACYEVFVSRAMVRANAVLFGEIDLLGHPVRLGEELDWHRDPRTGHQFPRRFYAEVPRQPHDQREVDVKYIWELGRHQYLSDLARGWLFSGEDAFGVRARELMLDWIDQNPLYEGIHWTSGLELAMRSIAWLWTLEMLRGWNGWSEEDLHRIELSLKQHGEYLEHHLSLYSSPYNHLIGEATALYLLGQAFRGSDFGKHLRERGRDILNEHGPRQFYADGFCVEQAMGYHFYTLGFLAMALIAGRSAGEPFEDLDQAVHRAFLSGRAFRQPNGRWPAIGDVDSARSIPVHHDDFWNFDSICNLAAVLFDDHRLKCGDADPGEETYWLLGCWGLDMWKSFEPAPVSSHVVLPESGYAVASVENDWLLFEAGPMGAGLHADGTPSTAHGHADALQVLYCLDGEARLIDTGMPYYFGSEEWVGHFRSPAAHSTIEIEDAPVARSAGGLDWTHVVDRGLLKANLSKELWLAQGRFELDNGKVLVERFLLGIPETGLYIADRVVTDRPRGVSWFWQMPQQPSLDVRFKQGQWEIFGDRLVIAVSGLDESPVIERADKRSPVAWHAPGYGLRTAGQRLRQKALVESEVLVLTFFGTAPLPARASVCRMSTAVWAVGGNTACLDRKLAAKSEAAIVWQIGAADGPLLVMGGISPNLLDSNWELLTGNGGWPAAVCRSVPSDVPIDALSGAS
jgi:hypothetical protein